MQKLKIGDTVQIISGAERSQESKASKRGKIVRIDRAANRVTVEGVRMIKRHMKKGRDRANPEGGILEKAGTVARAAVAVVCPKCDAPTRIGIRVDGEKPVRFCKKCDAAID